MHTAISCAACTRPLRIPSDLVGQTVRCPFCTDAFVAVADPAIKLEEAPVNKAACAEEEAAPPPGLPSAAVALLEPEPPVVEESFTVDLAGPAKPAAPPKAWSTWVFVRNDTDRRLWGKMQAEISAEGVRLYRGRKELMIPVGCEATWVKGSLVRVVVGSRTVEFQLKKKHIYKSRLAADVAGFLNGDRPMPANKGYGWPWYQWLLLLAPLALIGVLIAGELPETAAKGFKGFGIVMFALLGPLLVYWLWHLERLRVGVRWAGSALLVGSFFFFTALMYWLGPDLPPAARYASWFTYTPPGGRYAVLMPATPREYPPEITNGLTVTKSIARVRSNQTSGAQTFVVAYADLKQWQLGNAFPLGRQYVLNENNSSNAWPFGDRTITLDEYSGMEFTFAPADRGRGTVTARLYLVGSRLYILTVKDPEGNYGTKFLDSFRVDTPGRPNLPSPLDMQSLIAYWSFDNVQGDWVNEDTGRLLQPLRLNGCKSGSGVRNRGLVLPGGNACFEYGASRDLNFAVGDTFTVCGWFKTRLRDGVLVSQRNRGDRGTILEVSVREGRVMARVCQDGNVNARPAELTAGGNASDGAWHHFALVRNFNGHVELYFDGEFQSQLDWPAASGAITTDLRALGCDLLNHADNPWTQNYQGSLDEFCVFRRGLREDEIKRLAGKN
jgi:hypothetical protein